MLHERDYFTYGVQGGLSQNVILVKVVKARDIGDRLGGGKSNMCILNDNSIKISVLKPEFSELRIILSSTST